MKSGLNLARIAAIAACVSAAAPAPAPAPTTAAPAAYPTLNVPHSPTAEFNATGPEYYLRTEVLSGDKGMGGLYVQAYHISADENDATLGDIRAASAGFLNGTYQEFDLGSEYQWGLFLAYQTPYTQWLPVQINGGLGGSYGDYSTNGTFALTDNGLVSTYPEWTGWIACDWSHGVPQLFWQYFFHTVTNLPRSCATVKLFPVLIAT